MKLHSKHISLRNTMSPDKPNEDFCIFDDEFGIYILLDGVSRDKIDGKYPVPSPALRASEIFADSVYKYLREKVGERNSDLKGLIKDAMAFGNEQIALFNAGGTYSFLPGTVGIVMLINDGTAHYGFIGDCFGSVVSPAQAAVFTRCQTAYIQAHKGEYTANEIRNFICNNISHPAGYGVLTGSEKALDFIELGQVEFGQDEKIFLYTDGFEKTVDSLSPKELYELSMDKAKDLSEPGVDERIDDRSMIIIERA